MSDFEAVFSNKLWDIPSCMQLHNSCSDVCSRALHFPCIYMIYDFGTVQCRITSLFKMIRSHNKIAAYGVLVPLRRTVEHTNIWYYFIIFILHISFPISLCSEDQWSCDESWWNHQQLKNEQSSADSLFHKGNEWLFVSLCTTTNIFLNLNHPTISIGSPQEPPPRSWLFARPCW